MTPTPELNDARSYLRTAQEILTHWRRQPNAPRWLLTQAEQRVLAALDLVWDAQTRARKPIVDVMQPTA